MTSVETTPLLNPTVAKYRQNQVLVEKPELPILTAPSCSPFIRQSTSLATQQMDISAIAKMEKFDSSFMWKLSDQVGQILFSYECSIENLLKLAPLGNAVNVFMNAKSLKLTIHNTNNFSYQGMLLLYFDPSPTSAFYVDSYGFPVNETAVWQFLDRTVMEPNTRDAQSIVANINIPFDLFQYVYTNDLVTSPPAIQNYINNYSFGRINLMVVSGLQTTATTTNLEYRVTLEVDGFEYAGNKFV